MAPARLNGGETFPLPGLGQHTMRDRNNRKAGAPTTGMPTAATNTLAQINAKARAGASIGPIGTYRGKKTSAGPRSVKSLTHPLGMGVRKEIALEVLPKHVNLPQCAAPPTQMSEKSKALLQPSIRLPIVGRPGDDPAPYLFGM